MSIDISINYWSQSKDKKLNWEIKESTFETVDIPYANDVIAVVNDSKDWINLLVSWPQIISSWNLDHVRVWNYTSKWFSTQRKMWETVSKVSLTFLKYNWELLMFALHKALMQCDMWTNYVLQILKKIEENDKNIEEISWNYEWQYSSFTNMELRDNWWKLIINDDTLERFVKWWEIDWTNWMSDAKIIRV